MSATLVLAEVPGDVLSPSAATTYTNCGAKYLFGRVLKMPDPPTGALTMGNAVHAAIGENFRQKIETKRDLPAPGVQAIYLDAWENLVAGTQPNRGGRPSLPTEFRDDEMPADLKAEGLALTLKYLDEACPSIEPAAVELPVAGRIGGVAVRGYIDLLEVNGRVRDIKTAKRTPTEVSANYRFQVSTYTQISQYASGEATVDTLVKLKTPKLVSIDFTANADDASETQAMYPLVQQSIRAGHFIPNRQNYMCSRKYCSFWRECERRFGGKVAD